MLGKNEDSGEEFCGLCKSCHEVLVTSDSTAFEMSENFITELFQKHGIIHFDILGLDQISEEDNFCKELIAQTGIINFCLKDLVILKTPAINQVQL